MSVLMKHLLKPFTVNRGSVKSDIRRQLTLKDSSLSKVIGLQ